MHLFKRLYLLFSLVFSLIIPLVHLPATSVPVSAFSTKGQEPAGELTILYDESPITREVAPPIQIPIIFFYVYIIYSLVVVLLLFRFIKNLQAIYAAIRRSENISTSSATLVLTSHKTLPHTFINYVFVNGDDYRKGRIEPVILQHEFTHARQYHSLDIIFFELMVVFCWFNPFLWLYGKDIQLNHEFLADEAVLNRYPDTAAYQSLLLHTIGLSQTSRLESQFNHSITKQRFLMMTKKTSLVQAWTSRILMIIVVTTAALVFCSRTEAMQQEQRKPEQRNKSNRSTASNLTMESTELLHQKFLRGYPHTEEGISDQMLQEYAALVAELKNQYRTGSLKHNQDQQPFATRTRMEQIFKQMNRSQQLEQEIGFTMLPPKLPKKQPTQTQLTAWQNKDTFGVWIDGKRTDNSLLKQFKPADFGQVFISRLSRNAINAKHHQFQVDLMTNSYYASYKNRKVIGSMMYHHKPRIPKNASNSQNQTSTASTGR